MGQYFHPVNLDKKEYLHPHKFDDGLKLLEFGCSADGTMTALAILLRRSSEGGGGDIHTQSDLIGSWAGDRIVIIGDYDDSGLYQMLESKYKDISEGILKVMKKEGIVRDKNSGFSLRPDMILRGK